MTRLLPRRIGWRGATFGLVMAALGLGLGIGEPTGITGLDEYWHSMRTALQSFETQAWFIPQLDGEPRIQKPPLFYWMMMLSFEAFGVDFWSARLPALLFGVIFAATIGMLYRVLFCSGGTLAFMISLSLLTVAVESRRAMLDLPLATCVALTVLFALLAMRGRGTMAYLFPAVLALAAGFMIKGPLAVWFVIAALLAARLRPLDDMRRPSLWTGFFAATGFLLLAGAWPLWVYSETPDVWARLVADAADRQFGEFGWRNLTAVPAALLAISLPWTGASVAALRGRFASVADRRVLEWLVAWVLIAALPFFFFRTFERYLLPLAVPMALLAAYALRRGVVGLRWKLLSAVALATAPVLLIALLSFWLGTAPAAANWLPIAALSVVLLGWVLALVAAIGRHVKTVCVSLIVMTALTLGVLYPGLGVNRIPDEVVVGLRGAAIAHFDSPYPGTMSVVLGRNVPRIRAEDSAALATWAGKSGRLVLREEDLEKLLAACRSERILPLIERDFSMFYARVSFARFARPGTTTRDWLRAIRARAAEPLKPRFFIVRLVPDAPRPTFKE